MANIVEDELIKAEILEGLKQVDENLTIQKFESVFEKDTRRLRTYVKIKDSETAETFEINNAFG